MIVSCVFRCIMHVYIDRVRKQILETIGLMTTFLICGAAFSFSVSHHCYSNTVKCKIFIDSTRDNFSKCCNCPTKDFNPKLLVSVHQFIIYRVSAHIGVPQLYWINFLTNKNYLLSKFSCWKSNYQISSWKIKKKSKKIPWDLLFICSGSDLNQNKNRIQTCISSIIFTNWINE